MIQGFGVWSAGFKNLRFRVQGLWPGVLGSEFCTVEPSGFRVHGLTLGVQGLWFGILGLGFRVSGFGFRVSGFGFRV